MGGSYPLVIVLVNVQKLYCDIIMFLWILMIFSSISLVYSGGGFCATCGFRTYITFDYGFYTFLGAECEYLMAEDCDTNMWAVKTTKELKPLQQLDALMISKVKIEYNGAVVEFFQDGRYVQVDGANVTIPYYHNPPSNDFSIDEDGYTAVFSDNSGSFKTTYNFRQLVMIELGDAWKGNKTCGLCGSYNDNKCDDEPEDKNQYRVQEGCGDDIPYGECRDYKHWVEAIIHCHETLDSIEQCAPIINEDWYSLCYREYCTGGNKFTCQYAMEFGDVCHKFLQIPEVLDDYPTPCETCYMDREIPEPYEIEEGKYDDTKCDNEGGICLEGDCEGCKNGYFEKSKKNKISQKTNKKFCGNKDARCCKPNP